jgi:hypothetical protein
VAQNISARRGSNIDGRTTRHAGIGSAKLFASGSRRQTADQAGRRHGATKLRGVKRVEWAFVSKAAAYNLIRLPRLLATG